MNAVILLVDRNASVAQSSKRVLEIAGYEVIVAKNDEDARHQMRERHIDVVVVMSNVEDESERKLSAWHEDYVSGAFYHRTNADPQHLLDEIEREVGGRA